MLKKEHLVWLAIGIGVYYLFLKYRVGLVGAPWRPSIARQG